VHTWHAARTHAATFLLHAHPVPRGAAVLPDPPRGYSMSLHLPDPQTVPVGPLTGLCSFATIFDRLRRPWPTCRCAWRCACTAATKPEHSTTGIHARVLQWH
jgi:hypothetical protein